MKHGGPLGMQQRKRKSDASEAYPRVPYWLEQPQTGYHFAQVSNKQEYNKDKVWQEIKNAVEWLPVVRKGFWTIKEVGEAGSP